MDKSEKFLWINISKIGFYDGLSSKSSDENYSQYYGIADLEISQDGKYLATIDTRGLICIWNLIDKYMVVKLNFSQIDNPANAEFLAHILNINTHNYYLIQNNFYYSYKKKFNYIRENDLEKLLQEKDGESKVLSEKIPNELLDLIGDQSYRLMISSDSKHLFAINGFCIGTWDLITGKEIASIQRKLNDFSVDPVKNIIYIPSSGGVEIWNLTTGKLENQMFIKPGLNCLVNAMKSSDKGNFLVCCLETFSSEILKSVPDSISSEFELGQMLGRELTIEAFSLLIKSRLERETGDELSDVSLSDLLLKYLQIKDLLQQFLYVWDINTRQVVLTRLINTPKVLGRRTVVNISEEKGIILHTFARNSKLLIIEGIDINTNETIYEIEVIMPAVNFNVEISGDYIFVFDNNKFNFTDEIYVYDIMNGSLVEELDTKTDIFSNQSINTESDTVIVGCADSSIHIYDFLAREKCELPSSHNKFVSCVSSIASNQVFASAGGDRIIKVWKRE